MKMDTKKLRTTTGWILAGIGAIPALCLLVMVLVLCLLIALLCIAAVACLMPAIYLLPNGLYYTWESKDRTISLRR